MNDSTISRSSCIYSFIVLEEKTRLLSINNRRTIDVQRINEKEKEKKKKRFSTNLKSLRLEKIPSFEF